jgi:hypothetical protein
MLLILILAAGFVGATTTLATEEKDGILRFTPETANDVVAQRVFHDQQGRVCKRIYYVPRDPHLRFEDRAKLTEADVVASAIEVCSFDSRNRLLEDKEYSPDMVLRLISYKGYDGDKTEASVWGQKAADGRKIAEYRMINGKICSLFYDHAGQHVITMDGPIPPGLELSGGWGDEVAGISCHAYAAADWATASIADTMLEKASVGLCIRNNSSHNLDVPCVLPCHQVVLTLRNEQGEVIAPNLQDFRSEMERLTKLNNGTNLKTDSVAAGEAKGIPGVIRLKLFYPNLSPGNYQVTCVYKPASDRRPIVSNVVAVQIKQ